MKPSIRADLLLSALLLAGLLHAQAVPAAEPTTAQKVGLDGGRPVHCRATFFRDPAREATLSWSTAVAGAEHRVHYDTEPRKTLDEYRHRHDADWNGRFTQGRGEVLEFHYHHARLRGLQPSTRYYCVFASGAERSREFWFLTAPADDRPFKLLFGGDSRSGHDTRLEINRYLRNRFLTDLDIVALVHGGDYVMFGDDVVLWATWLDHHEVTTTKDGRLLPVIPVRGNHEAVGRQFGEVFGWPPEGPQNWYACRLGADVLLVVLNSETPVAGDQLAFLKQTLQENQGRRWQLAAYHSPAYPAYKRPGPALRHWVPVFEAHRLDLVLECDGHVVKRTVPILAGAQHADGIVYVGEGGLGVRQRRPKSRWYLEEPGMADAYHHVFLLSFGPTRLQSVVYRLDATEPSDTWSRAPRSR